MSLNLKTIMEHGKQIGLNEPFVYIEPNRERIMPFCKHFVLKGRIGDL